MIYLSKLFKTTCLLLFYIYSRLPVYPSVYQLVYLLTCLSIYQSTIIYLHKSFSTFLPNFYSPASLSSCLSVYQFYLPTCLPILFLYFLLVYIFNYPIIHVYLPIYSCNWSDLYIKQWELFVETIFDQQNPVLVISAFPKPLRLPSQKCNQFLNRLMQHIFWSFKSNSSLSRKLSFLALFDLFLAFPKYIPVFPKKESETLRWHESNVFLIILIRFSVLSKIELPFSTSPKRLELFCQK